jgi:hypothetical protein
MDFRLSLLCAVLELLENDILSYLHLLDYSHYDYQSFKCPNLLLCNIYFTKLDILMRFRTQM